MIKKFIHNIPTVTYLRERVSSLLLRSILRHLFPVITDKALIRMGPAGDGGYLIPDDLDHLRACFSPGVNTISDFELECAEREMEVFMVDGSVEAPPIKNPLFNFRKIYIGEKSTDQCISMDDWIQESIGDDEGDLILQMDIEGHEYKSLNGMSEKNLQRFRIIVIEFHGLNYLLNYKIHTFKRLLKNHTCVHIHPNNCEPARKVGRLMIPNLMEFTFLRNDRVKSWAFRTNFPHELDVDNTDNETLVLPQNWHAEK